MKEVKDQSKQKHIMFVDCKALYGLYANFLQVGLQIQPIPIRNPASSCQDLFLYRPITVLKFIWSKREVRIAKRIFKKKNKIQGFTLSDFKTYYKKRLTIAMKTVWYYCKDKLIDQ